MADQLWRDIILMTLREVPSKKVGSEGKGYGLWVVMKVKPDGSVFNVTVRSGQYFPNKLDGSKTLPKDGLNFYDFMALRDKSKTGQGFVWDDIKVLLDPKNPPAVPKDNETYDPQPEEKIEEMPW